MAIKIPQNQLIIKYTTGKEYFFKENNIEYEYVGYYYKLNGKIFAGDKFNTKSPILIEKDSLNLNKNGTNIGSNLPLFVTLPKFKDIQSIPMDLLTSETKYFAKKINVFPTNIINITEEDYDLNKDKNPFYTFTSIEYHSEWGFDITEQNIKDIPEIEIYLQMYKNSGTIL